MIRKLLSGWNSSSKQWLHNLKALAPLFRAIAPDLPGFGDSEESELFPYTLDDMASFLEELRKVTKSSTRRVIRSRTSAD